MGDKRIDPELVAGSLCFCCPVIFFLPFFFASHLPHSFTPPPSLVCVTRLLSLLSSLFCRVCRSLSSSYVRSLGSTAGQSASHQQVSSVSICSSRAKNTYVCTVTIKINKKKRHVFMLLLVYGLFETTNNLKCQHACIIISLMLYCRAS